MVVEADYLLLRQAVENIVRNAAARGDRVTIALDVEALEVRLDDVTRPYRAPTGKVPRHD